jgi:hypothetical protein
MVELGTFNVSDAVNKPVSLLITVSIAPFIEAMPEHFRFGDIYLEKIQAYVSKHPALKKSVPNFAVDRIRNFGVGEITIKPTFQYGSTCLLTCL